MANTKKAAAGASQKKPTTAKAQVVTATQISEEPVCTTGSPSPVEKRTPEVQLTDMVCVRSCFYGNLVYVSKKTGAIIEWQNFDAEQYMTVEELLYMRNSQPRFFKEPWIRIVGDNADAVFRFLSLERYNASALSYGCFADIFRMPVADIEELVSGFGDSMKESFARYARMNILDDELTDLKVIKAIENATGFGLLN